MALDSTGLRSRRALLAGALGAVGTAAAATIVGAQRVLGAGSDGEPVVIGGDYPDVRSSTVFRNTFDSGGGDPSFRFHAESSSDGVASRQTTISPAGITLMAENIVSGGRGTTLGPDGIVVSGGKWAGVGVSADMNYGPAIVGRSEGVGVKGQGSTGVHGDGASIGLRGESAVGRGGRFKGKKAQIKLDPSAATNHPSGGARGDLFVDKSVRLWFCRGGTDWVRLA